MCSLGGVVIPSSSLLDCWGQLKKATKTCWLAPWQMYSFSLCWILQTAQHFVLVLCPVISKHRTGLLYLANKIAPYKAKLELIKHYQKSVIPASQQYLYCNISTFLYILSIFYLYLPTYQFIYLCMYGRCTCMYVSVSISIHTCWLIHLYMYVCTHLSIYVYCYMYVSIFFIHTHIISFSFCGLKTFPFLLISFPIAAVGESHLWATCFHASHLTNGPWEDTEREVESPAASLTSRLLRLLLPLSSFALPCCLGYFLQDIAPIFLWYLPSTVFILKDPPSFPPTSTVLPFLPRKKPWSLSILTCQGAFGLLPSCSAEAVVIGVVHILLSSPHPRSLSMADYPQVPPPGFPAAF